MEQGPATQLIGPMAQPGTVLLGKYRVERVIGLGGMGAVVAARHLQLDERVAIKFLLPAMLQNEELTQRFLREAKAAIKIRSEHCVRVLDVGTLESGAPYMVMEYLEGQDLSQVVHEHRPLPIADVIDWVLQAAEALAEAHVVGIVHRDLKPANLFLTRRADGSPCVKVLDFGISKQTSNTEEASVTKTQAVLGSPRYMSPEQMRSTKDVDARADVWALGAVAHELIAGEPPFDAETMTALCASILQDPPRPIAASRGDVPVHLEAAVRGALEKDRTRRYQNVAQLAAALAPFGSPSSHASAERIARVLGARVGSTTGPATAPWPQQSSVPAIRVGAYGSNPAIPATTTGGSGSVAAAMPQPPKSQTGLLVLAAGIGVVMLAGTIAVVVALTHRDRAQRGAASGAAASAAPSVSAAPVPSASVPGVDSAPVVLEAPSAEPSATAEGSSSATPPAASQPHRGAPPPHGRGNGPSGQPPSPNPNSNPFGDDRKG